MEYYSTICNNTDDIEGVILKGPRSDRQSM